MKKVIYGFTCVVLIGIAMLSCEKEPTIKNEVSNQRSKVKNDFIEKSGESQSSEEYDANEGGLWVTPTGIVIPFGQRDNWLKYVDSMTVIMKAEKKGYRSQHCIGPGFNCGLKCVQARRARDCVKEEACAPCLNCGCTPVL
jgi:hypothetical protein